MKINQISLIVLTALILFGCSNQIVDKDKPEKPETPSALKDEQSDVKIFSRDRYDTDLVEELYQGLLEKRPELKKLEDEISLVEKKRAEEYSKFNSYDSKSMNYYNAANQKTNSISDSILKTKIKSFLEKSEKNYENKKSDLTELVAGISKNDRSMSDSHTILKIGSTIDLMQKYQADNKPETKNFKEISSQQKKIIQRIDSLTPKY